MFFRNLFLYRIPADLVDDIKRLEHVLDEHPLRDVGPLEMGTSGFVPPIGRTDEGYLTFNVGDCMLLCFGRNDKLLPAAVINDALQVKLKAITANEGRKVGGRERKRLIEDLVTELLPRAFVRKSTAMAYIDLKQLWLVIDTSSRKSAENVISAIREALGSFPVVPLAPEEGPRVLMSDWIASGKLPERFAFGSECELRDPATSTGAKAKCTRQDLDAEEVKEHLRNGKQVFQLGMMFNERIDFVLNEDLSVRKLRFTDVVWDELSADGSGDAASQYSLMTLELRELLNALDKIFGLSPDAPLRMHKQDAPEGMAVANPMNFHGADDPLYLQAIQAVLDSNLASISSVQRILKIGYNRATRLIEAMESAGIVSAPKANGERTVSPRTRNEKAPGDVRKRAVAAPS